MREGSGEDNPTGSSHCRIRSCAPALRPARRCRRPTPPPRLPRARPSPSPDSGSARQGAAQLARFAIPAPVSPSLSPLPGYRPSRPQGPFATRSTHSEPGTVDSGPAPVAPMRTRHGSSPATAPSRPAAAPPSPTVLERVHVLARRRIFPLPTRNSITFGADRVVTPWSTGFDDASMRSDCQRQRAAAMQFAPHTKSNDRTTCCCASVATQPLPHCLRQPARRRGGEGTGVLADRHRRRARGQDRREDGLGAATVVKATNSIAVRKIWPHMRRPWRTV